MERTYRLKRIPVWPVTRVSFLIFLILGIIIAVIYSVILSGVSFLAGSMMSSDMGEAFGPVQSLGLLMIPFIAVFYAVFGTIGVIIWTLLYNFIAGLTGGVELVLKPAELPHQPAREVPQGDQEKETHVPEGPIDGF